MTQNKPKILFIAPYPFGKAPSQRFRFEQYWDSLSEKYEIKLLSFWNDNSWDILYSSSHKFLKFHFLMSGFFKRFITLFTLRKYNYLFIHRESTPIGPPIFEWLAAKILRKNIIYDFDDAVWLPNVSQSNKFAIFFKANWKTKKIAKWASLVICGNQYLADFTKQFNTNIKIIPTTIDTENAHSISNEINNDKRTTIGWTGTVTTLDHLDILIPIIKKLEEKYDISFRVICNKNPEYKLESFEFIKWKKETEISDLSEIDIGVMPLPDNEWSKGKCGFKGLQYMSLEIPTIMSPVGVNNEIIENGVNGFLASTEDEWIEKLSLLVENKDLRLKLGKAGRKTVVEKYSVSANQENYLNLFQ